MEKLLEYIIGVGDGLSDVGIDYLDEVFKTEDNPVLKKASTWGHIGVGVGLIAADQLGWVRGRSSTICAVLAGRHIGKAIGEVIKAAATGKEVFGLEKKSEVEFEYEEIPIGTAELKPVESEVGSELPL